MRLLRLELERYGHFTDRRLDFRTDACLHVVYGPNEAGKSSSLDAITDLLFGFAHITPYDFLHDKTKLAIGATLEKKDATRLTCKRRKGTKNTLLDTSGKPLAEGALQSFLGSVSRSVFQNAFGLSKDTLRTGAEEMLRSGGEAGSSLIAAAAGLKGLSELRRRLDADASAIFAPTKAQHRAFYQARERQEEAAKSIRQLELRDRDLKDRHARITTLEENLASVKLQRAEVIQRREFLLRQREIGPLLLAIAANEDLLKAYEHLPAVDGTRILELRSACDQLARDAAELQRLNNELSGARATAGGFVVDASLIALAPAINVLVAESGNYAAQKAQLPRVQGEADQFRRRLDEYRMRLGLAAEADVAQSRPSDLVIANVKGQISAGKGLESNATSLAQAIEKEQATRKELVKQQAKQTVAGDPKPLRERLTRLMPALSRLPEAVRLERTAAKESEQLRERALQLAPAVADLDAMAMMSLPSAESITEFADRAERLARELATRQATHAGIEKTLPALRAAVESYEQERLESTPERIQQVRTARTAMWAPLRSILLRESDPLPAGESATRIVEFEETIDTSDRLADDAVRNADRLAHRAAARKRLEEEEKRLKQAESSVAAMEAQIAANGEEWTKLWAPLELVPLPARKMESWLSQVDDLLERRETARDNRRAVQEITDALRAIDPAFREMGHLVGIPEADRLPAEVLLKSIQDEIEARAEAWRQAHEIATLVQSSEARLEELEREQADLGDAKVAWSQTWSQVMTSLHLAAGASLDEAAAALEIWQQVPSTVTQLEDRARRVQGMQRDMKSFEARTAALFAQLEEQELGVGADAAIKTLSARVTEALKIESMARMAEQRVTELKAQIVTAEANVAMAQEVLDALCSGLPPAVQRSQQIAELETREAILKALREQRKTLVPLSRGKAKAELRAALQGFDGDAAAAELEELQTRQTQLSQEENELFANLREAAKQLAALENGTGAEIALQLKRNAETQLVQCAREWAVKRVAQMLLSHAIEHFRSQQEAPLLKRAGELFSLMTGNSFAGVEQAYDDDDNVRLVGRRAAAGTVGIEGMSEGTRDQLYLALRLAYLEDYASKTEPLPFIGDDLLANFDDERTRHALAALGAVGSRIQPILFTHHQRVVELAESELGQAVDVISLQ